MYEVFIKSNEVIIDQVVQNDTLIENLDVEVKTFFKECSGYTLKRGLYRTHTSVSSLHWAIIISNYFPGFKGKIIPFGYDWMGRQFAINTSKKDVLLMFDPATAEYFELQQNIALFHNQEMVYDRESILSEQLFDEVMNILALSKIKYNDCLGYKVLLFLGGADSISNYEVWDIEVYWEMQCQIYLQIKDLPPGTKIKSVNIK